MLINNLNKCILYSFLLTSLIATPAVFSATPEKENKPAGNRQTRQVETKEQLDQRMGWWREARFGMFIHWGLYAVPAGEWKGRADHAEWIMHTAKIPVEEYELFAREFNPVKFDARKWVSLAKEAGMKYIVITSKHHDGFCLFNSEFTDYDIMDATPFKHDILKELSDECHKQGLKICWYHSIMDWHHPDYLPRRQWEKRPFEDADFKRYISHMKNQLRELATNYGKIGVLWFDGEWESTWTSELGQDLYRYVRSLQPDIIINNRVGKGREGMAGLTKKGNYAGDFGTPEQEIPSTGLPEVDWETCMTMNDHWGYNKHDQNWKSKEDLIRKLVDIASKGGNFLLNIGPTAEGLFPQLSIERLKAIGEWMKVNQESIHGTTASPFKKLSWGRCTQRPGKLYLHVFNRPADGRLKVPGLQYEIDGAYLLAEKNKKRRNRAVSQKEEEAVIDLPLRPLDAIDTVVVLNISHEKLKFEQDIINTSAGDLKVRFIGHGTLMFAFKDKVIHVDPVSGLADYTEMPKADIILITHEHGDHLDPKAIKAIQKEQTKLVMTRACAEKIDGGIIMNNTDVRTIEGLKIEAVPAYNIVHKRSNGQPYHPKGRGNGYVITFGDKRVYIAGDTENTPEMKELKRINIAFLPMNLPYTMTPQMAADAAKAFKPKILCPYHYGQTDPNILADLLKDSKEIEVRIRKMR